MITTKPLAALLMAISTTASAIPLSTYNINTFRWTIGEDVFASAVFGSSNTVDSVKAGSSTAGAKAVFAAIDVVHAFADSQTDSETPLPGTNLEAMEWIAPDVTAFAGEGFAIASASVSALATTLSEAVAIAPDGLSGLLSLTAATASGTAEAYVLSYGRDILADAGSSANWTAFGDGSTIRFSPVEEVLATSSASSLGDSFSTSRLFLVESKKLATGLAESSAQGVGGALFASQAGLFGGDGSSHTDTYSDAIATVIGDNAFSFGNADSRAISTGDVLVSVLDEMIIASSASSQGSSFSDSYAVTADRWVTAGSRAGFVAINTVSGLASSMNNAELFAASSNVQSLVYGYSEAWIQRRVPEPMTLSLVSLGLLGLLAVRTSTPHACSEHPPGPRMQVSALRGKRAARCSRIARSSGRHAV